MFRRLEANLPQEPSYPSTLAALDYKLEDGQFIKVSDGTFFPYHSTSNERVNDLHREAMHSAARHAVAKAAGEHGVIELYLSGADGSVMSVVKPEGKHVKIMCTELERLRECRNVVVVVGEMGQDLGIWAYRELMNEGGLDGGSVVGLAKELEQMAFGAHAPIYRENPMSGPPLGAMDSHLDVPGLIIFNPGQLLYSHDLNQCMTQKSWMARPKDSVIGSNFKISAQHNFVNGHSNPFKHIETMFDKVVPQLIHPTKKVRLFVVGITDGAEGVISYMDSKMSHDNWAKIGGQVTALAFCEPTHNPDNIVSEALRNHIASYAKSWIKSSKPIGKWINCPTGMEPLMSESQLLDSPGSAQTPVEDGEEDEDEKMSESYDYLNSVVSCHTFSGGTDIDEMIFVNVMEEVLGWFKWIANKEDRVPME